MSPENDFNVNRVETSQQIGGMTPIDKHQQKQHQEASKKHDKKQQQADEQAELEDTYEPEDDQKHNIDYRA